jgi:hypothetical protein
MAEAVSGILPRKDKATAIRALRLSGEALGVAVGIGRFYADPQGLGASLPSGPLSGSGRDNERRTLGPDAVLHIRAWVRSRHGAFRQAAFGGAAHAADDAEPQGDVEAEACARTSGREEGSQRGMFVG